MADRTNPHAEIIVGAQDQATPVFDKIKSGAQGMAQGVEQSAKKAADSVGKIGDNATPAAGKVDNATKSIIASIERATAAMKAGEKGSADYFNELAKQRGVNADLIKPYTDELRRAQDAQKAALLGQQGMAMSAKQTAAALRGVPAQITDIFVSLQGGQAPMTVLLQQGGQLKDMFGGIVPAVRALGGVLISQLANPVVLAAGVVGGLALAYNQGSKEADTYRLALVSTGNAVGTTTGQLNQMAVRMDAIAGTQGKSAETLAIFATQAVAGSRSLEQYASAAIAWERATGQAVGETAKQFASLKDAPLQGVTKLNESMNFLTESTYKQIKSLEEQGKTAEAAKVAQDALANALNERSGEMEKNLGAIERGWRNIKDVIAETWDAIKSIGRDVGPEGQLAAQEATVANLEAQAARGGSYPQTAQFQQMLSAARQRLADLQHEVALNALNASIEADRATSQKARIEADKDALKYLSEEAKMRRQIAAETEKIRAAYTGKTSDADQAAMNKEIAERDAAIRKSYEKTSKTRAEGAASEIASINAKIAMERQAIASLEQYGLAAEKVTEGERIAARLQEELKGKLSAKVRAEKEAALAAAETLAGEQKRRGELERQAKAIDESEKAYRKYLDGLQKSSDAIGQQADQQEAANASYGKSKTALEELTLAQMKLALATAKDAGPWSPEAIAKMEEAIKEQERYVNSLKNADFTKANRALDEAVTLAQEQQKLTLGELSLVGMTELERRKIIAAREIELDLAKELRDIDKMTLEDEADREILYQKAREKARIRTENAIARETLNEWQKTADQINQSLTDALMRGFESGKGFAENLRDTVVNMFKTMVLRPVISAVLSPISAGLTGALGLAGTAQAGTSALSTLGNVGGIYSGLSSATTAGLLPSGLSAAIAGSANPLLMGLSGAWGAGGGLMSTLGAGTSLLGSGSIMSGLGVMAGALGPIALGLGALVSLLGKKSTPHMGGAGSYSAEGGASTGLAVLDQGLTFGVGERYYNSDSEKAAVGISQGIVQLLDSTAQSFGQQAGYFAATAFADDSSKDGAWGSLRIMRGDEKVLDWADTQTSKWAPKEFSDGEAGQKEYAAAIAASARDALKTALGDADWAKDMLDTLGDSVTLEGLDTVVAQINQAKAAFTSFGQYMPTFAGLAESTVSALVDAAGGVDPLSQGMATFVENFYSDAEKLAVNTENVRQALQDLGFEMPETRDEFKALVQAQLALGDAGAKTAAGLLGLSGAFAAVTPAAESAQSSIASVSDQLRDAFGMTADAVSGILSDAVKNAETASEAQRMAAQAFEDKFYGGALDGLTDSLGAMIQSSVIAPMMESLIAGSAASASLLASGGAVAAGAMASGGAAGGAASAAGGSSAAGAMASGGASAANAMVSGGSAAGAIVASAVEQARAQVNAYTQILSDPDVQAGIKDISKLMGEVAGMTFSAKSSWGGGGYSAASFNASGAGSEADKLAESLKKLGETVSEEIKRLAGLVNESDPQKNRAALLAEFAIQTAKAKTGDQEAMGELTSLSKAIEQATKLTAASAFDLSATRGWLASSLEDTLKALNLELPKFDVGTNYVPRTMAAIVHEGEAIVPKAFNPWAGGQGAQMNTARLEALVERLAEENRQQAGEIARLNLRMARVLERWDGGGMPPEREETI